MGGLFIGVLFIFFASLSCSFVQTNTEKTLMESLGEDEF